MAGSARESNCNGRDGQADGARMSRLDLTRRLLALLRRDEAVVAGIGNTNFDLAAAGDRPQNFYMLGSMGLAAPIALGVALAQPERQVLALEGDGSLLMNLGCLATIAMAAPPNLTVVVWDNGAYQITGNQRSATAGATDLVAVARGAGIARSAWAADPAEFERLVERALRDDGPALIGARVDQAPGAGRPERDPVVLKDRFMRGLGAKGAQR
jgi:thiamine pyrophosphate-dependent acetolactate synthase large subunit-like protein